jgi:phosphohistidine phosphatase
MRLYLLRHGIAEEWRPDYPDEKRRLTEEGKRKVRMIALGLSNLKLDLDLIVTSPLPRARETAEIVAEILGCKDKLKVDDRLAGGFGLRDAQGIISDAGSAQSIMLVGHEPGLSMTAGSLTGGSQIDLKKGGLIRIDLDEVVPGKGMLKWLVAPALFIEDKE